MPEVGIIYQIIQSHHKSIPSDRPPLSNLLKFLEFDVNNKYHPYIDFCLQARWIKWIQNQFVHDIHQFVMSCWRVTSTYRSIYLSLFLYWYTASWRIHPYFQNGKQIIIICCCRNVTAHCNSKGHQPHHFKIPFRTSASIRRFCPLRIFVHNIYILRSAYMKIMRYTTVE